MSTMLYPSPVFGPVQSRRLGHSLGINLLPADGKVCNFDCVYCECGLNIERRPKNALPSIVLLKSELERRLIELTARGAPIDAITFAGNGEPTSHPQFSAALDVVSALRDKYYPEAKVCLLTNATHLVKPEIFEAVKRIDRACLKLDSVDPDYIRRVDRPTSRYDLDTILDRMRTLGSRCVIQTLFMKGEVDGVSVDNTQDDSVLPWLAAVKEIAPSGVDVYTLSRETPLQTLKKASQADLERIVKLLKDAGIDAHAFV